MRSLIIFILSKFEKPIDFFLSIFIIPAAYLMLIYRRLGPRRLPITTSRLIRIGVFPIRNHYYEPLFDDRLISTPLEDDRYLPGIQINEPAQIQLLHKLCYQGELMELNLTETLNPNRILLYQQRIIWIRRREFLVPIY